MRTLTVDSSRTARFCSNIELLINRVLRSSGPIREEVIWISLDQLRHFDCEPLKVPVYGDVAFYKDACFLKKDRSLRNWH